MIKRHIGIMEKRDERLGK